MTSPDETAARVQQLLLDRTREEPPLPALAEVLGRCREDHHRHRRRLALGAVVACVLVLAPLLGVALSRSDQRAEAPVVDVPSMSDQEVVDRCLHGNQSARVSSRFVASGEPVVRVRGTVAQRTTVALVSADGRYWAECFINHGADAEFASGMTAYDASATSVSVPFSAGFACPEPDGPPSPPCPTFLVDYLDRLPAPVASVDFATADGRTTNVPTVDGFVLFTYLGEVPAGYSRTVDDPRRPWLEQVTYRDADGRALAAARIGIYLRMRERTVDGLPLITRYPSQRSQQPLWEGP